MRRWYLVAASAWEGRGLGDDIVEMPPSLVAVAVAVSSRGREAIPSHDELSFPCDRGNEVGKDAESRVCIAPRVTYLRNQSKRQHESFHSHKLKMAQ